MNDEFFILSSTNDTFELEMLLTRRRSLQIRTRNYLTAKALSDPKVDSGWRYLDRFGDDGDFIAAMSIDRSSFDHLYKSFCKYYSVKLRKGSRGRPMKLNKRGILALILHYYTGTLEQKSLCQIFGVAPATCCVLLKQGQLALNRTLKDEPDAAVKWPTLEEQAAFALLVERKNPYVKGRWGFIDGKNYRVQTPTSVDVQNAYYNGWLHSTLVTGCFCFAVDGTIIWGRHNCPGSWNDGEMSRAFQEKIARDDINLPDHGVLADSAFPVSGRCYKRIITPCKEGEIESSSPDVIPALALMSNAITSMRQSAEWGMGAVSKVYRQLTNKLPFNPTTRRILLENIYRLYNFRVRRTGISQIRNYFYNS
jgi:hypothetical protein